MSFPRYEKYKESGVEWLGEVPEHWSIRRMKTLFEIKKRIAGEIGYDILSITQNGIKVKDTESNEGQVAMDYAKYQFIYPGDFAMNHMDLLTGYIDISKVEGVTSPDYRVFSVRNPTLSHPGFFLRLFQNAYHQKIFYAFGQGASQFGRWRLPIEAFNDFALPYPPLSDAQRVAGLYEWNQLGRKVKKGERGIRILAPVIGVKRKKDAEAEKDICTQNQAVLVGFRSAYVFDVSQTEGKELPELSKRVRGNVGDYRERLVDFILSQGIQLEFKRASRPRWV